jgi:hypothetical protein
LHCADFDVGHMLTLHKFKKGMERVLTTVIP